MSADAEGGPGLNQEIKLRSHAQNESRSFNETRIYEVTEGLGSKQTAIVYQRCFNRFMDHIQIHDKRILLDHSQNAIKQKVIDYILFLRDEKGNSCGSIKTHLAAILRFFQINNDDFSLTIKSFKVHLPSDDSVSDDRGYTVEEIGQVIKDCDIRSRVVILLMCSTGMRRGALHLIRISDLTQIDWNGRHKVYRIQVYARTRDMYITFCTPECAKAVDEYLDYRARYGEKLRDEAPLIREQFNTDNPFTINAPSFVSQKGIEYLVDRSLRKAGVRKPGRVHLSHGMRKFFLTQCESTPMKSLHVSLLAGHDTGLSGHYYRPKESDILADYMTHAADTLTIDPNQRLKARLQQLESQQSQEIERLKTQLQGYREEQARAQDTSKESIRDLRRRLDATEDKHEKALLALEHARKTLICYDEKHRNSSVSESTV